MSVAIVVMAPIDSIEPGGGLMRAKLRKIAVLLLGQGGEALQGERLLAAGDLLAEHGQQAAHPVGLVAGDHRTGLIDY